MPRAPSSASPPRSPAPPPGDRARSSRRPRPTLGSRIGKTLVFVATCVVAWKLRFLVLALFMKARFLLIGLAQLSTLFDMILSIEAYGKTFGAKLALGVLATSWAHELGHVALLSRAGVRLDLPRLLPLVGGFFRLDAYPPAPRVSARAALAGSLTGTLAAALAFGAARLGRWPSFTAIAHVTAWLNLFHLLPVWRLDGSRALRVLSRPQRLVLAALAVAAWVITREGLFVLWTALALFRAWREPEGPGGDRWVAVTLAALLAALASLLALAARSG